jgi:hypothetical protein
LQDNKRIALLLHECGDFIEAIPHLLATTRHEPSMR